MGSPSTTKDTLPLPASTIMNDKSKDKDKSVEEPVVVYDVMKEISKNLLLLERVDGSSEKEKTARVLRNNARIRDNVQPKVVARIIEKYLPENEEIVKAMRKVLETFDTSMEMDEETEKNKEETTGGVQSEPNALQEITKTNNDYPQTRLYLGLLIIAILIQHRRYQEAIKLLQQLITYGQETTTRTADSLLSKAYGQYALCHERLGSLGRIRSTLLSSYRKACLRYNAIAQATLLNSILRSYILEGQYEQASKLVSKTEFPLTISNNQLCRYLYYVGKIRAIQLDYTDAHSKLMQSIRKTPQNTALGFRKSSHKLAIIVQLLMGEIPERSFFSTPELKDALSSYFELTNAVRTGNLEEFSRVLAHNRQKFKADKMHSLVLRLRHNVIKIGLRRINVSYSKISFKDIAEKLALDGPQDAEFICTKAIRDGVIDAVLDHQNGWMQSKELEDVYSTTQPQEAFHKRITFCFDVHNEAIKAMRYPPDAYKKDLESAEERREREKAEEEFAQEIEDDMDDDL